MNRAKEEIRDEKSKTSGAGAPLLGGQRKEGKKEGEVVDFPPLSPKEEAFYAHGQRLFARQVIIQAHMEKNFPLGLLKDHKSSLLLDVLMRNEQKRCDTSVPDLRKALEAQQVKVPAPPTLRAVFDRFLEAGYIHFKHRVARTDLYEPTHKLRRLIAQLAASLPADGDKS